MKQWTKRNLSITLAIYILLKSLKLLNFTAGYQSDNQLWFELRRGRITASVMGSVLNCNSDRLYENYIVGTIKGIVPFFSIESTEYGKTIENVARSQYLENI